MTISVRPFSSLYRWTAFGRSSASYAFDTVTLDEVLRPRAEEVVLSGGLDGWTPISIHFDGSISIRGREEAFKGRMFSAYPGDLVFSKIDARNGAIGIVPDSIPKVVLTPEYPVYVPDDERVRARFLALLLRTPTFQQQLRSAATGTSGRKRVSPDDFEAIEVPLPSLPDQDKLLSSFDAALKTAAEVEARAVAALSHAQEQFDEELGLLPQSRLPKRFVQVVRAKDLERWSHEGILARSVGLVAEANMVPLGELVADLENGWSPQCEERPALAEEWGVLKLGAVSFGVFDEGENKALPRKLKPRRELEVRAGDVLISRANVTRLVGACAWVESTRPQLMLCDKIFRVRFGKKPRITPRYLSEIMKSPVVRQQIESAVTGTSPTMKNIAKPALLDLLLPLPASLDDQERIAEGIIAARSQAAMFRRDAKKGRNEALTRFERAIFT